MGFGQNKARDSRGGGALTELFEFQKRIEENDGAGNTSGAWATQFTRSARRQFGRGTEKILAAASTSIQPAVLTVRACSATRAVDGEWRAVDVRSGQVFNIHTPEPSNDRAWIDFIVSSGGATG